MHASPATHNWPVAGHDWAVDLLRRSIASRRVRHAYLITGPDSVGKETLARAFAMALNCVSPDEDARPCGTCRSCRLIASGNHPDIIYSEQDPDTGTLKIEAVRAVTRALAMKPFEARYRVAILRAFDRAQGPAQDSLLKTLEEPPPSAVLLVLARGTEALLPTIISRSQVIPLRPVAVAEARAILAARPGADPQRAAELARVCGGRLGWALAALDDPAPLEARAATFDDLEASLSMTRAERFALAEKLSRDDKAALEARLELWQSFWRDVLLLTENSRVEPANADREVAVQRTAINVTADEALTALKATRSTLLLVSTSGGINVRLALEVMFLDYPGLHHT